MENPSSEPLDKESPRIQASDDKSFYNTLLAGEQNFPMTTHPVPGKEMKIFPASDFMQIIPGSAFLPMEILKASEDLQLETLHDVEVGN